MKRTLTALAIAATALAIAPSAPAGTKTCLVNQLRYTNEGGYKVDALTVHAPGYAENRGGVLYEQQSRTLELDNAEGLSPGSAVWLSFKILDFVTGDKKQNCRKNDTKLVYDPDRGNTWDYYSDGTTQNRNRCRFGKNTCVKPE